MQLAEIPKLGWLCDLALAGLFVALLARPGSPQHELLAAERAALADSTALPPPAAVELRVTPDHQCAGDVQVVDGRTIVTIPDPDQDCIEHVRVYRGAPPHWTLERRYERR